MTTGILGVLNVVFVIVIITLVVKNRKLQAGTHLYLFLQNANYLLFKKYQ